MGTPSDGGLGTAGDGGHLSDGGGGGVSGGLGTPVTGDNRFGGTRVNRRPTAGGGLGDPGGIGGDLVVPCGTPKDFGGPPYL